MERYEEYQTTHSTDSNEEHIVLPGILSDKEIGPKISRKTGIRKVVVNPAYQVYHIITEEGDCTIVYETHNGSWSKITEGHKNAVRLADSKLAEIIKKSAERVGVV